MKRNLLLGILGGAAVGAAASLLFSSEDRRSLVDGIRNIGDKASDMYNNLMGGSDESADLGATPSTGRSRNATPNVSPRNTSRRG